MNQILQKTWNLAISDLCRTLTESSPVGTAFLEGPQHVVRYVNSAFCLIAEQSREELMGKEYCSATVPGLHGLPLLGRVYRTGLPEVSSGDEGVGDRRVFSFYAMWPALDSQGCIAGVLLQVTGNAFLHQQAVAMNEALLIGSVRQHELAAAAEELNENLRREIAQRKRAEEDLREFAYAATHDLQEPLRTVTIYNQMLAVNLRNHGDLDPENEQFLKYIAEGNSRMYALIKDLLAFVRAGEGRQPGGELVDCNEAMDQAITGLRGRIEETHASITRDRLPQVRADLPQLTQLFQNLMGNALKYQTLERVPTIHVGAEARGNDWVLSVRDNGIGFAPSHAERIFGIFKRLHGDEFAGTGIGLAICKRIVERHGGRIWAVGEIGQGATFSFSLPG